MARARNIKPGFFTNDVLASCTPLARLLFVGLWTVADSRGITEDRPLRIKGMILPYDNCDTEPLLNELASAGFIIRYESAGVKCLCIPNFVKHQRPHPAEPKNDLPDYETSQNGTAKTRRNKTCKKIATTEYAIATSVGDIANCPSSLNPSSLNIERGILKDESPPPADLFADFWEAFPKGRKGSKELARTAWGKAIQKAPPQTIIAAAIEYAASYVGQGDYVKGPAPWLNQGCWDDDRAAWQEKGKAKGFELTLLDVTDGSDK